MRRIFAFLMASLDGYHEASDGDLSWHNVDAEFHEFAVRIMMNPVVLGSGHPILAGAHPTKLELLRMRQFGSGNVLLTYKPAP
jgi:dihydrofolate reductase